MIHIALFLAWALGSMASAHPIHLPPNPSAAQIADEIRQQAPFKNRFVASDGAMILRGTIELIVSEVPLLERGAFIHQLQLVLDERAPASNRINAKAADHVLLRELGRGPWPWRSYDFSRTSTLDVERLMRSYDPVRDDLGTAIAKLLGAGQVVINAKQAQWIVSGVIHVDLGLGTPATLEDRALWLIDQLEVDSRLDLNAAAIYIPDAHDASAAFDRISARIRRLDRLTAEFEEVSPRPEPTVARYNRASALFAGSLENAANAYLPPPSRRAPLPGLNLMSDANLLKRLFPEGCQAPLIDEN